MAEIIIQQPGARRVARGRTRQPIEADYHDGMGRFGIEAVSEDGTFVILYLSIIEAIGLSASLRSEIGRLEDVATHCAPSGTIGYGR